MLLYLYKVKEIKEKSYLPYEILQGSMLIDFSPVYKGDRPIPSGRKIKYAKGKTYKVD